ncbi:hypothetical protein MRX96_045546 [Rhipicephalus microplus]
MVRVAEAMEAVMERRRIFEVSFDEYVGTVNGLFNVLEICGGFALYLMMGKPEGRAQGILRGTGYTFSFNGLFMVISGVLSATSGTLPALHLLLRDFPGNGQRPVHILLHPGRSAEERSRHAGGKCELTRML